MDSNTALFIIIFLLLLLDFSRYRKYLSDKRFLISGIVSNLFLFLFIVLVFLEVDNSWLYVVIALGMIPGVYFQSLKFRKDPTEKYRRIIPAIVALIILVFLVIKALI